MPTIRDYYVNLFKTAIDGNIFGTTRFNQDQTAIENAIKGLIDILDSNTGAANVNAVGFDNSKATIQALLNLLNTNINSVDGELDALKNTLNGSGGAASVNAVGFDDVTTTIQALLDALDSRETATDNTVTNLINTLHGIGGAASVKATGFDNVLTDIQAMLNDLNERKLDVFTDADFVLQEDLAGEVAYVDEEIDPNVQSQIDGKAKKVYTTPEEFGAIGDGVANDAAALQSAINYCVTNKIELRSYDNKVYKTNSELSISGRIDLDFGNATIKAGAAINSVLNIGQPTDSRGGYIKNIILDANSLATSCLYNAFSCRMEIDNVVCNNIVTYGLNIPSGYENIFRVIRINGNGTSTTATAVFIDGGHDNHFEDVITVDCKVCINLNNGGGNVFVKVHGWLSNASLLYSGSIFAILKNTAEMILCYSDTYEKGWNVASAAARLKLVACKYFINDSYITPTVNPFVFYFDDISYSQNVIVIGCDLYGLSASNANHPWFFNKTTYPEEFLGEFNEQLNYTLRIDYCPTKNAASNLSVTSGWNVSYRRVTRRNKMVFIELDVQCTGYISAGSYTIATIPPYYKPLNTLITSCDYADSTAGEYGLTGRMAANITTGGNINIISPGLNANSWVKMFVAYPI